MRFSALEYCFIVFVLLYYCTCTFENGFISTNTEYTVSMIKISVFIYECVIEIVSLHKSYMQS